MYTNEDGSVGVVFDPDDSSKSLIVDQMIDGERWRIVARRLTDEGKTEYIDVVIDVDTADEIVRILTRR